MSQKISIEFDSNESVVMAANALKDCGDTYAKACRYMAAAEHYNLAYIMLQSISDSVDISIKMEELNRLHGQALDNHHY